jgi:PAT family beta-lactamase induction signal transducer AmpG
LVLAKVGLTRKTLMMFVGMLVVPNLTFLYLASSQPDPSSFWLIAAVYCVAMFAYGFGAVAHMYYMMKQIAPGEYQTAHYAFATGTMGLCNFLTGFFSGKIEEALGYQTFFTVVLFCAIPGLLAAWFAPFVHSMKHEAQASPEREAAASAE